MSNPRPSFSPQLPKLPEGTVVASFSTYEQARAAVDTLARHEGFSLRQISIVGSDLKSVERVIGRMSAGRAALGGAMTGMMMGLFLALMWLLVYPQADFRSILGVFLLAIAFGTIWSVLTYALSPRKREFTSMMQLTASRFDLLVPNQLAAQAAQVLGVAGAAVAGDAPGSGTPGQSQANGTAAGSTPDANQPGGVSASDHEAGSVASAGGDAASNEPPQRPRTYGEMQDELRRQQARERDASQE